MKRAFIGRSRTLGILIVAAALATGAYAFTATNTVPDSNAGSGSGTISGYTVSAIAYTLNATTPSNIDSMTFTLNTTAATAKAKIVSGSTTYTELLDRRRRQRHLRLQPGHRHHDRRPAVGDRDLVGRDGDCRARTTTASPGTPAHAVMSMGRITGIVTAVVAAAAFLAAWMFFAPTQVGGGTSYAIIVGNSMEPELHRGDLAVVRERSIYRAGDVVLYDSRELGSKVLHRIVRVENGRFVLKGDNNSFLDSERITEEQIVGSLWTAAPGVGRVTEWLREPLHSALLVGLVTLIALGGGVGTGVGAPPRRPARSRPRVAAPPRATPDDAGWS